MRVTYPTVRLARYAPDRVAILDGRRTLTYKQLEAETANYAQRLVSCGVRPGDRVVLAASNSVEWIILNHAIARIGAILAPMNTRWSPREANGVLDILSPRLVIADDQCAARLFGDIRSDAVCYVTLKHERPGWRCWDSIETVEYAVPETVELSDLSTIITTSGSSGHAKLVALTYGNHVFAALSSAIHLGHRTSDRWLISLPLFHIGGLAIVYRAAISGFAVFVQTGSDINETFAAVSEHRVTHLSLVGTTLQRLLGHGATREYSHQLRAVLVGGGGTDVSLLREARHSGMPVMATYGMTETASQVATMSLRTPLDESCNRARAMPLCTIEVCDDTGRRKPVGENGRICIRGPMVAHGYWGPQGRIRPLLDRGWFRTDDVGTIDSKGRLCVLGRSDDVIISGGENISLSEVERVITQIDGVRRAIVLAHESVEWGHTPVAFVEANSEVDEDTVRMQLRDTIASFKFPSHVRILPKLPETAIGKVDRQALKRLLSEG